MKICCHTHCYVQHDWLENNFNFFIFYKNVLTTSKELQGQLHFLLHNPHLEAAPNKLVLLLCLLLFFFTCGQTLSECYE